MGVLLAAVPEDPGALREDAPPPSPGSHLRRRHAQQVREVVLSYWILAWLLPLFKTMVYDSDTYISNMPSNEKHFEYLHDCLFFLSYMYQDINNNIWSGFQPTSV